MPIGTGWTARLAALALVTGLGCLPGCVSADDARVLQVLNQRGFGRPTHDANRQYYIGIGDSLVLRSPSNPELNNISEQVRMDGVITLPNVGEVYVNGLTPQEASEVVRLRFAEYFKDTSDIEINVKGINSKFFYIVTVEQNKPKRVGFKGDILLIDAMAQSQFDPILTDTEDIRVIRGDPENPLVISCDFDKILKEGYTRHNIVIRENDLIYLSPSIVGYITRAVQVALSPIKPLQQLIAGANNTIALASSFGQGTFGGNNNNQFGNFNNNF